MRLVAVCISRQDLTGQWDTSIGIPFYSHTAGFEDFPHFPRLKTRFRIEYLANRRNAANKAALEKWPETTHILQLDSYYVKNSHDIKSLIKEYAESSQRDIVGASSWFVDPSRIRKRYWYWDSWTNPEFNQLNVKDAPHGWVRTKGAGGMCIYPRWVWETQGYGIPEPFPESGCEANYLSRCPGVSTYISFNVKAWRDPPEELKNKPYVDRVRTSLGIGTRMRKMGIPDIAWILRYRVFLPVQRYEWLKGWIEKDGFTWYARGVRDPWLAYHEHEKWMAGEILRKGRLFIDVGAHVGTWSVRASKYYDDVVSFEPSIPTRRVLEKNIHRNQLANVHVLDVALGDVNGTGVMHGFSHFDGGNSLLEKHPLVGKPGKIRIVNKVDVRELDSYHLTPDLLKIDTEGYELQVLHGASQTLYRAGRVIVESHRDEDVLKIRDVLQAHGLITRLSVAPQETHVIGERLGVQDSKAGP